MGLKFFNKITGQCGEDAAVAFLKKNKYKIIARNHRNKCGEIDIIAQKENDLVFVEVKTRRSSDFGTPAEAITYYKKKNFVNTVRWYLMEQPSELNIRFDVIEVYGTFTGDNFELENIEHFEQVFDKI